MEKIDGIVTVASWEPRFVEGLKRLLNDTQAQTLLMFYYREFDEWTSGARRATRRFVNAQERCTLREVEITFESPSTTWQTIKSALSPLHPGARSVLVDITTMPRETIWSTFFWLEKEGARIHYAYHQPASYATSWLARDPSEPRLAFKLAGTPVLSRQTSLIVVTGFDVDRVAQAVEFYQPARTVLLAQSGQQFDNTRRNVEAHRGLKGLEIGELVEIDVFAKGHGYSRLKQIAVNEAKDHNILLFSFGPKTSAVALYRVQREIPESTLAFIHCKEYNRDYSKGIGPTITGTLPRRHQNGVES